MSSAEILGIVRHRLGTDGKGVTTLVGFYGCPLRCKYCLNPQSFAPDTRRERMTPSQLYDRVKQDDLYFLATGGGITFGGGEPLLNMDFLEEFKGIVGDRWRLTAETSLAVGEDAVLRAMKVFHTFVVDVKDTDPQIYLDYTGKSNERVLENLRLLAKEAHRVTLRLPLIKGYNSEENIKKSEEILRSMGYSSFDKFEYRPK